MTPFLIKYPPGATPLSPDERDGLIPDYITTHSELNELEQDNIQEANLWVRGKKSLNILEVKFVYELHKQMFGKVWRWAGKARKSDKNIGVDWHLISTELPKLLEDLQYWITNKTYSWDEIGARFHHHMVQIHVFPNGNGRHARLITDLTLEIHGQDVFSWGMKEGRTPLDVESNLRRKYIDALVAADKSNYAPLFLFVRS